MWCTVHVLYRNGIRLPAETAKASGVVGWLHMNSNNPGQGEPLRQAFLLPRADVPLTHAIIEPLRYCTLRSVMGGGI